jgi:hypothetical protein
MSGFLIQSTFGNMGNFEVVVPSRTGVQHGLVHYWRNNDDILLPWSGPTRFGEDIAYIGASLIQSNFGSPGNLEVVAVDNLNRLVHFWRDATGWHGPFVIAGSNVRGIPGLIQGRFGFTGNFEVVVPALNGGLFHFWRNNNEIGLPWSAPSPLFAQRLGQIQAVSLIESNFGVPGNLEVAAMAIAAPGFAPQQVFHLWRGNDGVWSDPTPIPNAVGFPALIQSKFGMRGNFELVVNGPAGLNHFWRNNDFIGVPWSGPTTLAVGFAADVPSMIESNFGAPGVPGNLEVIAEGHTGPTAYLAHLWRDSSKPNLPWSPPVIVETASDSSDARHQEAYPALASRSHSGGALVRPARRGPAISWARHARSSWAPTGFCSCGLPAASRRVWVCGVNTPPVRKITRPA